MNPKQQATLNTITSAVQGAGGTVESHFLHDSGSAPVAVKITLPPSTVIGVSIDFNGQITVLSIT